MSRPEFQLGTTPIEFGRTLIEASAGTGKTFTIAGLVTRLVAEEGVEIGQFLVVTFTEAATAELGDRIRSALGTAAAALDGDAAGSADHPVHARLWSEDPAIRAERRTRLERAVRCFDDAWVATIHGFCRQVLERVALESGTPLVVDYLEDETPVITRVVEDFWRRQFQDAPPPIAAWAVENGVTPTRLLELWRDLSRHGVERIEPRPRPLDEALAVLGDCAIGRDEDGFDAERLRALFADAKWRKDQAPFGIDDAERIVATIEGLRSGSVADRIRVARELAAERVHGGINKRGVSKAAGLRALEDPFLLACQHACPDEAPILPALIGELLTTVARDYAAEKERLGLLSFDDLLTRVRDALADPARGQQVADAVARRVRVALIDEFQDTDQVQWAIFERIFRDRPEHRLFLIGDPKQAIYRFRGADVQVYLAARDTADRQFTLRTCFRSRQAVLDPINVLFRRPGTPFAEAGIDFEMVGSGIRADRQDRLVDPLPASERGGVHCLRVGAGDGTDGGDGDAEGDADSRDDDARSSAKLVNQPEALDATLTVVVRETLRLLDHGRLRVGDHERRVLPGDFAVLVRKHDQAQRMQDAFASAGIPSAIGKGGDVFQSDEFEDWLRIGRAVLRPRDTGAVRAALATWTLGLDAAAITALTTEPAAAHADAAAEHARRQDELVTFLDEARQAWVRDGFQALATRVLRRGDARARFARHARGPRRLTNLLHTAELLHHAGRTHRLSPEALLDWGRAQRDGGDDVPRTERELRLETDASAVQIVTMHASKGLQYEIVFCPFLGAAQVVQQRSEPKRVTWRDHDGPRVTLQSDELPDGRFAHAHARAETERLADELRLAYVALTRAQQRAYLVTGPFKNLAESALGWLLAGPTEPIPTDGQEAHADMQQRKAAWKSPEVLLDATTRALLAAGVTVGDEPADVSLGRYVPPDSAVDAPPTVPPLPRIPATWRLASFSALARSAEAVEARDVDDPAAPTDPAPAAPLTGIHAFARGREAGNCLHAVFERVDWARLEPADLGPLVAAELARAGLDLPGRHVAAIDPERTLVDAVRHVATVPLPPAVGDAVRFADLASGVAVPEWGFDLQMVDAGPTVGDLPNALRTAPDTIGAAFATQLDALPGDVRTAALRGYLTGSVDLVAAFADGRHWVVDWKSNWLGPSPASYGDTALEHAMIEHRYVLQYHLYLVALHRHLRARLGTGYDYDRHIGGALYVFVRGVDAAVPGSGCFVDRPPRATIEALDAWLGRRPGERP